MRLWAGDGPARIEGKIRWPYALSVVAAISEPMRGRGISTEIDAADTRAFGYWLNTDDGSPNAPTLGGSFSEGELRR